jgi:hypothetical protein
MADAGGESIQVPDAVETIRTSEPGWLAHLARAYRERRPAVVIDDAAVGIDPRSQTILDMARRARLSPRELGAVAVAVGVSGAGAMMVVLAFLDPEPTSKLGLLVGGGVACVLGGGFAAIRVLVSHKPPRVTAHAGRVAQIEIAWD